MSGASLPEIAALLNERAEDVARSYAPGGFVDKGIYKARCPWREDRRIGSFIVNLSGARGGRWKDFSTGEHGDMLDLIRNATGKEETRALMDEARAFLGLEGASPALIEAAKRRAEAARRKAESEAERAARQRAKARARALALFLDAQPLEGSPAAAYLRGRRVGPEHFERPPGALRFVPDLFYKHIDPETGEVFEGRLPAMAAAIHSSRLDGGPAELIGLHRTYLGQRRDGSWGKAEVPEPKKVLGEAKGGLIRIWPGRGPRGGVAGPLSRATGRIYLAEGIEDALSVARLVPEHRVAAAISLGNFAEIALPEGISEVVICADEATKPEHVSALERAIARFAAEGRQVRVWRPRPGYGKDFNDALLRAEQAESAGGAAA